IAGRSLSVDELANSDLEVFAFQRISDQCGIRSIVLYKQYFGCHWVPNLTLSRANVHYNPRGGAAFAGRGPPGVNRVASFLSNCALCNNAVAAVTPESLL